jgi:hypothetical protein
MGVGMGLTDICRFSITLLDDVYYVIIYTVIPSLRENTGN